MSHAATRATLITRFIWIIAHILIFAAILASTSDLRAALADRDVPPIVLAVFLAVLNLSLYVAVSLSDPGRVQPADASRGGSGGEGSGASAAARDATTAVSTPRSTSRRGERSPTARSAASRGGAAAAPDALEHLPSAGQPLSGGSSPRGGGGGGAAVATTGGAAGAAARYRISPGSGFSRVPVTDDADDAAFHDGGTVALGAAAAAAAARADGATQRLWVHVPVRSDRRPVHVRAAKACDSKWTCTCCEVDNRKLSATYIVHCGA